MVNLNSKPLDTLYAVKLTSCNNFLFLYSSLDLLSMESILFLKKKMMKTNGGDATFYLLFTYFPPLIYFRQSYSICLFLDKKVAEFGDFDHGLFILFAYI